MVWVRLAITISLLAVIPVKVIPSGTVIPVMVSTSLNASKDAPGKKIEGKVMQDVHLPSGEKIAERSRIYGQVVSVSKPHETGSSIVVKFDSIQNGRQTVGVAAGLLAVAGMATVADANLAISGNPDRDPVTQWVTRQVGGDVVYRSSGRVIARNGVLGSWVGGSSVLIKLTPDPRAGCRGGDVYDHEQSVWIFSSGACGAYGLSNLEIADPGRIPPNGEILLKSSRNVDIRGGSGWLLIVAEP